MTLSVQCYDNCSKCHPLAQTQAWRVNADEQVEGNASNVVDVFWDKSVHFDYIVIFKLPFYSSCRSRLAGVMCCRTRQSSCTRICSVWWLMRPIASWTKALRWRCNRLSGYCQVWNNTQLVYLLLAVVTLSALLHSFNGLFSRTAWVSHCQNGKTFLDCNEARDGGVLWWHCHQTGHIQTVCTLLQTDNHASTSSLSFYGPDALFDAHPTVSRHEM